MKLFFVIGMVLVLMPFTPTSQADPKSCLPLVLQDLIQQNPYWTRDIGATNFRGWNTYKTTLAMKPGEIRGAKTLIDIGAGKGFAIKEAVETEKFTRAIAIDIHDHSEAEHWRFASFDTEDKITHEVDPAEVVLPHYPDFAGLIVDNYGGYTYSPARIHILEQAFKALKPGGSAFFRAPPVSFVKTKKGLVSLETFLTEKYPKYFSVRINSSSAIVESELERFTNAKSVLVMKRPVKTDQLHLNLSIAEQTEWVSPESKSIRFPILTFKED
jgi:SAM-dependent methyltransferase